MRCLKNKKILITAGPTWVPIDSARVISNIATGETGVLLAEKLRQDGANVTLLLGPTGCAHLNSKIRLIRFKFFNELSALIKKELGSNRYDAVIHSAAVSDYKPQENYKGKVKPKEKSWSLNLIGLPKIIDLIKKIDKSVFLIGFKFEPQANRQLLIKRTRDLIKRSNLDLAVANGVNKNGYQAFIVDSCGELRQGPIYNKRELAVRLIKNLEENLCRN